jgi:nitrogen fixation protein NifU and related proteins
MSFSAVDFEELYQQVILDHSRRPRNFGEMPDADVNIEADNPMCGDEIALHLKFGADDKIEAVTFTGSGCSICMASASMMTQKLKKKTRAESSALMHTFHGMLTAEQETEPPAVLGDLGLLKGVRKFPLRVKCATLAWHALEQALGTKPGEKPAGG